MEKVTAVHVHCAHCGYWIPSPFTFDAAEGLDNSTSVRNGVQCPKCQKTTGCSKENIRVRYEDGRFVGDET